MKSLHGETGIGAEQASQKQVTDSQPFPSKKRVVVLFLLFSCLFSLAITLPLYALGELGAPSLILTFAEIAASTSIALFCGYKAIDSLSGFCRYAAPEKAFYEQDGKRAAHRLFLISFAVLEAAFLFALLSNYPGLCSPDSNMILNQVLGQTNYELNNRYEGLSNAHPVFYTFCVWVVFKATSVFGSESLSLFAFMFLQITFVAAVLSWSIVWLGKTGAKKSYIAVALCFFVLSPIVACHVIILWKDIPFAAVLLALVLHLAALPSGGKLSRKQVATLLLLLLAVSLLRNNGYYVALLTVIYLVIARKSIRRQAAFCAICLVVFMSVLQGPVFSALSISKGHFAESVGIPLQQLGATISDGGSVSDDDLDFLNRILPLNEWAQNYDPSTSNPLKQSENFDDDFLDSHKGEFLGVWLRCAATNKQAYLKAWILETYGYWQPGYTTSIGNLTYTANDKPTQDFFGLGYRPQKITNALRELFPNLFGMGSLIWFSLIALTYARAFGKKNRAPETLTPYIPLIGLIGTLLIAAPIVNDYRYIFALYLMIPFLPQFVSLARDATEGVWSEQREPAESKPNTQEPQTPQAIPIQISER